METPDSLPCHFSSFRELEGLSGLWSPNPWSSSIDDKVEFQGEDRIPQCVGFPEQLPAEATALSFSLVDRTRARRLMA